MLRFLLPKFRANSPLTKDRAPQGRRLQFECLEGRRVLAGVTDLSLTNLRTDPTGITVEYETLNQASAPFEIGIYRSSDGVHLDQLLLSRIVTDPTQLALGKRQQFLSANFVDLPEDYHLVAVVDAAGAVVETSEANNTRTLDRGVFQSGDGTVHVQGNDLRDSVQISRKILTSGVEVLQVSTIGTTRQYTYSTVTDIRIRTHGGNDTISLAANVTNPLVAFAGDGLDTVFGGAGRDQIYGGAGADELHGRDGDDTLYGQSGDDLVLGEGGNDYLIGGLGTNQLNGGGQPNDVVGQKPVIEDLEAFLENTGAWTVIGTVVDDGDLMSMRIHFTGAIEGEVPPMADGSFAITKDFAVDPHDLVFVRTMDSEGLISDEKFVFLG